jgi:hypothetical protein
MPSLAEYFVYASLTFGVLGVLFLALVTVATMASDVCNGFNFWRALVNLYLFLWLIVYPIGCVISWITCT